MAVVREIVTDTGTRILINDEYCAGKSDEERAADAKKLNRIINDLLRRK